MNKTLLLAAALVACSAAPVNSLDPDASAPDAAPLPGVARYSLPAGCAPAGALFRCDPRTNEGCDGASGEACDVDDAAGLGCYPAPNDVQIGGDCNVDEGPSCGGGLTCTGTSVGQPDGTCLRFCCTSEECPAPLHCVALDAAFGALGSCQ